MTSDEEHLKPMDIDTTLTLVELANVPMPDEIVGKIGGYLPPQSMIAWTRASATLFRLELFKDEIAKGKQAFKLKQLIVHGQEENALEMIKADPSLLFIPVPAVKDLSQDWFGTFRIIPEGSVFQTLLGMGYSQILNEEIVKQKILDNAKVALEQLDQQFPEDVDYPLKPYNFDKLIAAIANDSFDNDQPNTNTIAETNQFLEDFKFNITGKGWYFDLRMLEEIARIDDKNLSDKIWKIWQQSAWWSQRIYGYLQTVVTTFDAHVINVGIENVLNGAELKRIPASLTTKANAHYYPCRPGQTSGVGVDSYIGIYGAWVAGVWLAGGSVCAGSARTTIKKLCRAKTSGVEGLKASLQSKVESTLGSMIP